jgi:zinc and cadmium transporter
MLDAQMYAIVSVIIVSLIAVVGIVPFLLKKKISQTVLIILLSISVGVLLATVFFDFIPEIYGGGHADHEIGINENLHIDDHEEEIENEYFIPTVVILFGFLFMFIVEKFVHFHHSHKCESHEHEGHSHAYSVAPVNLIGDGIHNFIDGLIIAGSYIVSIPVGISTSISIALHELPQEIADIGVLLYSGVNKKKAVMFNLFSGASALIGTIIGLLLATSIEGFTFFIIPFAAGNFLYIAASNLLPQLHRHCGIKETIVHLVSIIVGILIVVGIGMLFPHIH